MTAPTSTPWSALAACRGKAPEIVFGEGIQAIAAMKLICAGCPFTGIGGKCLDDCREVGDEHFVRGGMTPAERWRSGIVVSIRGRANECKVCGTSFTGRPNRQVCHDPACLRRDAANRKRRRRQAAAAQRQPRTFSGECKICGKGFIGDSPKRQICHDPVCFRADESRRHRLRRQAAAANLPPRMFQGECRICGSEFLGRSPKRQICHEPACFRADEVRRRHSLRQQADQQVAS